VRKGRTKGLHGKKRTARSSAFEGKQAKLNHAIFTVLLKNPLIVYDITKQVKEKKSFHQLRISTVGRRVKDLLNQGYLEIIGSRETKPGSNANLFQLTTKAKVALYYKLVSRQEFLEKADEETLAAELATLKLFIQKVKNKTSIFVKAKRPDI
jgi:DNA-binding PadR family transcriptional regulator